MLMKILILFKTVVSIASCGLVSRWSDSIVKDYIPAPNCPEIKCSFKLNIGAVEKYWYLKQNTVLL